MTITAKIFISICFQDMSFFGALFGSINVDNTVTEIVNESISETVINIAQQCSTVSDQKLEVNLSGDSVLKDSVFSMYSAVDLQCLQDTQISSKDQQNIANKITDKIKHTSAGLFAGGINVTSDISKSITKVSNSFDSNLVQQCISTVNQDAKFTLKDRAVIAGITLEMNSRQAVDCIMKSSVTKSAIAELQTAVTKQVETQNSGVSNIAIIVIVIVIAIVAVLAFRFYMSMKSQKQ